jgi:hypothetical protein
MQDAVDEQITRAWSGAPDYRLALFRGDGPEEARNGPGVGWGYVAFKTAGAGRVHHLPFRISHQGYYVRFQGEARSTVVRSVEKLIARFKKSLQDGNRYGSARHRSGTTAAYPPVPTQAHGYGGQAQYGGYAAEAGPPSAAGHYGGYPGTGRVAPPAGQYGSARGY